jgi:hypothetical protein
MFWTAFLAIILALYIIGVVICIGFVISEYVKRKEEEKVWTGEDGKYSIYLILTSWIGVGIILHLSGDN